MALYYPPARRGPPRDEPPRPFSRDRPAASRHRCGEPRLRPPWQPASAAAPHAARSCGVPARPARRRARGLPAGASGFGRRHRLRAAGGGDPVRGRAEGHREGGREARGAGVRTTARGRDAAAARAGHDRARGRARHRSAARRGRGRSRWRSSPRRPVAAPRELRARLVARRRAPRVGGRPSEAGRPRPCCPRAVPGFPGPVRGPRGPRAAGAPARRGAPIGRAAPARRLRLPRPSAAPPSAAAPVPQESGKGTGADASKATTVELRTAGFLVYRRVGTESYRLPLGQEPLAEPSANDTTHRRADRSATWSARPPRSTRSSRARLERGLPRGARHRAARGAHGPAVLPREHGLEVLWTPSSEDDLAGYRVYREAPGEPRSRVAEVEAARAAWLDTSARPGVVYQYDVTAFDRAGNESPKAAGRGGEPAVKRPARLRAIISEGAASAAARLEEAGNHEDLSRHRQPGGDPRGRDARRRGRHHHQSEPARQGEGRPRGDPGRDLQDHRRADLGRGGGDRRRGDAPRGPPPGVAPQEHRGQDAPASPRGSRPRSC